MLASRRTRVVVAIAGLFTLLPSIVATGPLDPPTARADDEQDDRLAPIRDEVLKLEAEGRFESALALLRGVKEETLDAGGRLERTQRIDALAQKQLERYADDRTKAAALEKQGKPAEAAQALAEVEKYGSPKQRGEAKADQTRLSDLAQKSAAKAADAEKAKAAEDSKKKAVDAAQDKVDATKAVKRWLDARRQLTCSTCNGAKLLPCGRCEGSGKIKTIHAAAAPGSAPSVTYEDCGRCRASGRVKCGAESCKGSGVNGYKAKQVVWDALPRDSRAALEKKGLNEKRFVDGLRALLAGDPTPPEVELCAGAVDGLLEPIKGYDTFELALADDGAATARYFVKRVLKGGIEESRWRKQDGAWFLEPPSLDAPAPAKRRSRPGGDSEGSENPGKPGKPEPPPEPAPEPEPEPDGPPRDGEG